LVNFLVCGDIGAAANLVRNIMLLSKDVHWPYQANRLERLLKQYPDHLKTDKREWIFIEAPFRFFTPTYNADLSYDLNWEEYEKNVQYKDKPAVFINHSFVFEFDKFDVFLEKMPTLVVMPTTDLGLEWQIRAYCEKKGVDIMHNFTFVDNIEEQKADYIKQYGQEAWNVENIKNMKSIIGERRDYVVKNYDNNLILPLEWLLMPEDLPVINKIREYFNIDIDTQEASTLLNTWRSRHWPVDQTYNWKYA
jgi:hypothetical protein